LQSKRTDLGEENIKKICILFKKLTIVCYEREHAQKNRKLLEKKIITDNCLLRDKYNILNLGLVILCP